VKFQQILALGKYLLGFCLNFNQQILYSWIFNSLKNSHKEVFHIFKSTKNYNFQKIQFLICWKIHAFKIHRNYIFKLPKKF
jgi:hypothetical protein